MIDNTAQMTSTPMDETQTNAQPQNHQPEDDTINLLDLAIVLAKHKKTILGVPLIAAVLVAGISLLMPNIYTAKTVILPPQQGQSSASAMLGQLAGLAGGVGSSLGIKNPNDLYVGMLKSRTVADSIITRFKLQELYEKDTMAATYKALDKVVSISAGKDGLISVEVSDVDPERAADMANAYIEELYKLTNTMAVTEASQRRLFFEKQLNQAKEGLAQAEVALKETQEKTGLIQMDAQGTAIITAIGELRAQIAAKEVELSAMRTFATEQNPDYQRTQQALASLRGQLAKLERNKSGTGDVFIPTGQVPEAGLEYVRKLRDVKYYETIFELLAKQYELAKVDEAKDTSIIQVMDKAVAPDRKSKPKRALMVIMSAVGMGFLMLIWVFVREASEKAGQDPEQAMRLKTLRSYLAWRR